MNSFSETLKKAKERDPEALELLLSILESYFIRNSYINGKYDMDLLQDFHCLFLKIIDYFE